MNIKRLISGALAISLTLLCACNGAEKNGTVGSKKSDGSDGKLDAVISGHPEWVEGIKMNDIPDDQKDITIMMSTGWDYYELMHSEESPHPNIVCKKAWEETLGGTLTIKVVTETLMTSYLTSAIASDTAPDIIPGSFFPNWSITAFTEDLSKEEYAEYLDWDNDELWDKNSSKNWVWNGEWTGLRPYLRNDPWVIVYNKTKFNAAGEKTPIEYYNEGKWTWTQFVQTAKNMTDIAKDEYGYMGLYIQPSLKYKLDSTGHFYIDAGTDVMRKNTEIYNLFQASGNPARCSRKNLDFRTLFAGGTDAMTVLGLNEYERLLTTAKENGGDEFGMAPLFTWDVLGETEPEPHNSTWAYTICSASNRKIGAAEYVHLNGACQSLISKLNSNTKKSLYTDDEWKALEDLDKIIANKKVEEADREYNLLIDGFKPDDIMYSKQTLSMQGLVDKAMPVLQANLDKINKNIDLYNKE